jgi:hypothetical protein
VDPPPCGSHVSKTAQGPKVNCFTSSLAKDCWFFEFINQNQTLALVHRPKMDFFLSEYMHDNSLGL